MFSILCGISWTEHQEIAAEIQPLLSLWVPSCRSLVWKEAPHPSTSSSQHILELVSVFGAWQHTPSASTPTPHTPQASTIPLSQHPPDASSVAAADSQHSRSVLMLPLPQHAPVASVTPVGHSSLFTLQTDPAQPSSHKHAPSSHTPWPLQIPEMGSSQKSHGGQGSSVGGCWEQRCLTWPAGTTVPSVYLQRLPYWIQLLNSAKHSQGACNPLNADNTTVEHL